MDRASALLWRCTLVVAVALVSLSSATAQQQDTPTVQRNARTVDTTGTVRVSLGAMVNAVVTRVSPAYNSKTFTEGQLVQPVLMSDVEWRWMSFAGTLNGEGYTLKRGELTPGIFGEGYVDRRHPHTLVHEAMLAFNSPKVLLNDAGGGLDFSVAGGKGFVPFGSSDPMMRPLEKYPVNHHHAQIIERAQAIGAVRFAHREKSFAVEYARFNGDEPVGPFDGPNWQRFGDSWATRATLHFAEGMQLNASRAYVKSPEIQQGGAFDHAQQHASLLIDTRNSDGDARYLLAEIARTDEITNHRTAFQYHSLLAESAYGWRGAQVALRGEYTDRAEQSRLLDPFRAPLGHIDFQILGVTRWQVTTVALEAPPIIAPQFARVLTSAPFIEVARAFPTPRNRPTAFEPSAFYGASTIWSLTIGFRVRAGSMHSRMGEYGVLNSDHGMGASHHGM